MNEISDEDAEIEAGFNRMVKNEKFIAFLKRLKALPPEELRAKLDAVSGKEVDELTKCLTPFLASSEHETENCSSCDHDFPGASIDKCRCPCHDHVGIDYSIATSSKETEK